MSVVRYPTENLLVGDLWNLWERSVPLKRAFHSFGPPEDVAEYRRLDALEPPIYGLQGIADLVYIVAGQPEAATATNAYKAFTSSPEGQRLKHLDEALKERTRRLLANGQLFAIGFNTPRKAGDAPSLIPADSLQSYIWWDKDKIQHGSLKMENVRLGPGSWIGEILTPKPNVSSAPNEEPEPETVIYGRPSKQPIIWQAYLECVEAGKIDFTQLKSQAHRTVIAHIRKTYPEQYGDGKGLGEKTFLRVINEHFAANVLKLKRD